MDFALKKLISNKSFLLLIFIGMASELKATPVPPGFFAPIWKLLLKLKIVLLGEGELELSSEHREKLLDLTVNFLNSCKAVEADDLGGIDKACMKSVDVCYYSL